jgi:hypothetical protein
LAFPFENAASIGRSRSAITFRHALPEPRQRRAVTAHHGPGTQSARFGRPEQQKARRLAGFVFGFVCFLYLVAGARNHRGLTLVVAV